MAPPINIGTARMSAYEVARDKAMVTVSKSPDDLQRLTFTNSVLQRAVLTKRAKIENVQQTPKIPTSEIGKNIAIMMGFVLSKRIVDNVERNAQL